MELTLPLVKPGDFRINKESSLSRSARPSQDGSAAPSTTIDTKSKSKKNKGRGRKSSKGSVTDSSVGSPCAAHTHGVCRGVLSARRALCTLTECAWRSVGSPCIVHTYGVCLAFRRLAVHCAHSRTVPWRSVGSPCIVHTHGVCRGVPSARRVLCTVTDCVPSTRRALRTLTVCAWRSVGSPCIVQTYGVCLAFRRLAVHCAHSRSVPWRSVGSPCIVHTHGVCRGVSSARRALCTLTECAWRSVGSPCTVHTHGVCRGVSSARRALCTLTECACVHCRTMSNIAGARHRASGDSVRCSAKMPCKWRQCALQREDASSRTTSTTARC